MQEKLKAQPASAASAQDGVRAIRVATGRPSRPSIYCTHMPPASFHPGQPLPLSLLIGAVPAQIAPSSVRLYYRHVNQAERWQSMEMRLDHDKYSAAIPGDYTNSAYPLQYYFELQRGKDSAWLYPAFNSVLSNQPYYAISKRAL